LSMESLINKVNIQLLEAANESTPPSS
jgi:hypothetical protein